MTVISTLNKKLEQDRPGSKMTGLFKEKLFQHLSKLRYGKLTIEEKGNVYTFGNPHHEGELCAHIYVNHDTAYRDFLLGGSVGGAEAYITGHWSTPNLLDVVRLMSRNIDVLNQLDGSRSIKQKVTDTLYRLYTRNSTVRAKENITAHYDLSNEFFSLFLDPSMMYSSAIFTENKQPLEEAAVHKLDVICQKLQLSDEDHLVEIGTGWGGMAIHAAKNYGCKVTTTTISDKQYRYAKQRVTEEGLEKQIQVVKQDYRQLTGKYDKLVSIEMIEAVGHEYYKAYFSVCNRLLRDNGLALIQAITVPDNRYQQAKNNVDFIKRYIFPGGCLPSHSALAESIQQYTDMSLIHMEEIGLDYAKTLGIWRQKFINHITEVKALGFDDTFIRMWDYYLNYCQGGFLERVIGTGQFLYAKPKWHSN
ncbi:cyclopropane-fatty-acyl-phospholipid synthase family protein [Teredinibacter sp. KSP-S5-2]|uniref:cyclopropane-fatty-acyl-phospholipid synthase family protein n=1 Tax=Teredinibacter sp. KSP-S5-2 TaxID=3034506 RepID=UPI0029346AFC|nr:cyclopropane-fatty-acyl-phospholipid synthase family protein [Teredinibacter sp. KSP-S5-2]WNO08464.1 cyclopropane-fatty-acyl-phospholipid synthase [Teredinibacter sp. KSP-S5-2]